MEETKNYFIELNNIDVSGKVDKKNDLSYLSWAWAWGEVKKLHPDANYTIYENVDPKTGYTINYFTDGRTCWVKTGVTIEGIEHIEELPVMDFKNKSILLSNVTSFDVNKTIQRSLTKAVARHGLGLYIYAGEDLPEEAKKQEEAQEYKCECCGKAFESTIVKGVTYTPKMISDIAKTKYDGHALCKACGTEYLGNKANE